MRYLSLTFLALLFLGCSPGDDPRHAPVAWVDGDTLTVQRLAELLVLAQPMDLTPVEAEVWAVHWAEISTFGEKLAQGSNLMEPGLVHQTTRARVRETMIRQHLAGVSPVEASLTVNQLDSIRHAGNLRLVGHIFRRTPSGMPAEERAGQREMAQRLHRLLSETGQLSVVNLENQDEVARDQGGIRLVAPGDLPPTLEEVAYALEPGQLSSLVETGLGYHVVFRPRFDGDLRDTFAHLVANRLREEAEVDYLEGLVNSVDVEFTEEGMERVLQVARDPRAFVDSEIPVAQLAGGALEAGELARSMLELSEGAMEHLGEATAAEIETFVRQVVARNRLFQEAREDQGVDEEEVRALESERYREELRRVWGNARLWPDSLEQTSADEDGRVEVARWRVQQYLEAVAARRAPMESLPPLLTARLLEDAHWNLDRDRIEDALAMAQRLLIAAGYTGRGDLLAGSGENQP